MTSPKGFRRVKVWGYPSHELERRFEGDVLADLIRPGSDVTSIVLRPAFGADLIRIDFVRRQNRDWLAPWEATLPPGESQSLPSWREYTRKNEAQMKQGEGLAMVIDVNGQTAGLVTLGAVERGAMSQGILGYWIAEQWAGKGITSVAVAATVDLIIGNLGLHRVEINVRPENQSSLGLCRKLGFRQEGYKPRFMCIAGQWADHVGFGVDSQDLEQSGPLLDRCRRSMQ